MDLSKRLKKLRKEKGLKQLDIAKFLNISRSTYGHYETGHAVPSKESIEKLSDFFNVTVDYLLCRTNDKKSHNREINTFDSFIEEIDSLSEESKKELEKYIQLLKMKDQLDKGKEEQSSALEKEA